jgi:hypothetical protein
VYKRYAVLPLCIAVIVPHFPKKPHAKAAKANDAAFAQSPCANPDKMWDSPIII